LILAMLVAVAAAESRGQVTRTFVDRVVGGSLTHTNTDSTAAYELKHVSFTAPTEDLENEFSISHVLTYKLPDAQVSVVTTNTGITVGVPGQIETNVVRYAQGSATITNTFVVATTTNVTTAQFYDTDDFPLGWSLEYMDKQVFSITETNVVTLIRVYDVYARP